MSYTERIALRLKESDRENLSVVFNYIKENKRQLNLVYGIDYHRYELNESDAVRIALQVAARQINDFDKLDY